MDSNPEHDWPMEQETDVRERRQREEVEPPQLGRPAPRLTALARELGAIGPDQEARVMAEPGTPTQTVGLPAELVRRVGELLGATPMQWVEQLELRQEYLEKVRAERDQAWRKRDEFEKNAEYRLRRIQELEAQVEELAPTDVITEKTGPDGDPWAFQLARVALDEVQDLRASLVRSVLAATDTPLASLPAEVDRLVRYVLEGRP